MTMRALAVVLMCAVGAAQAAPFAVFPCKAGTPAPSECRMTVGAVTATTPPHTGATSGKLFCVTDLAGRTGTVTVTAIPANGWGAASAVTGTANMADYAAPATLDAMQVLPTLPQ